MPALEDGELFCLARTTPSGTSTPGSQLPRFPVMPLILAGSWLFQLRLSLALCAAFPAVYVKEKKGHKDQVTRSLDPFGCLATHPSETLHNLQASL